MSSWYRDLLSQLNESVAEIEHGFMKHTRDIGGLETYLKQMGTIPPNGVLLSMQQFEAAVDDGSAAGRPIFGYFVNLDERGEFYADVRDEAGKTVYEIRSEDESPDEDEFDGDMEESQGMVEADPVGTKYPELHEIAETLADHICMKINDAAEGVESAMPYKAQYILEEVIKILEERV